MNDGILGLKVMNWQTGVCIKIFHLFYLFQKTVCMNLEELKGVIFLYTGNQANNYYQNSVSGNNGLQHKIIG